MTIINGFKVLQWNPCSQRMVLSSFAIISLRRVELVVFLLSLLAVSVLCLFFMVPRLDLQCMIVAAPVHIRTYFLTSSVLLYVLYKLKDCWVQIKFSQRFLTEARFLLDFLIRERLHSVESQAPR